jgi:UDP-N-acetylmuramoyl-tripeptide--D-alanyl-D-alanine ligase
MPQETEFGIFEIGMNHAGEITPLVQLVRPHVAVITNIAAAHLGNFRSLEEIAAAKAEIFDGLEPGATALINRDSKQFGFLEKAAVAAGVTDIRSFGQHSKADYRLSDFEGAPESSTILATLQGETVEVHIGAPGRHIAENATAALGVVSILGADMGEAVLSLSEMKAVKGRGQRHRLAIGASSFALIDESYNANPASMRAAIAILAAAQPQGQGRRIAVLGDMLEMGEFSTKVHEELVGPLLASGIEHVWLSGEHMAFLRDALPDSVAVEYRASTTEMAEFVASAVQPGDVLMVKSSLGIGFGKIIAALLDKFPAFSDTGPQL